MSIIFDHTTGTITTSDGSPIQIEQLVLGSGSMTFPATDGTVGQMLSTDGDGNLVWASKDLESETAPTLGGNLEVGTNEIVSSSDITLSPTGNVRISGLAFPNADGNTDQVLKTDGTGTLSWVTLPILSDETTPTLGGNLEVGTNEITSVGDITLSPTGNAKISGLTYPNADGTAGQVLTTDGAGALSWETNTSGINSVSEDTVPALGGHLDVAGFNITSSSNGDVRIQPDGIGKIIFGAVSFPKLDGSAGEVLTTDGAGNLSWSTVSGGTGTSAVVDDTSPQLGGDLDMNGHKLVGDVVVGSTMKRESGTAIAGMYVLKGQTTGATSVELTHEGAKLVLPTDTTWSYVVNVAARRGDLADESAAYEIKGCIDNNGGVTALVGTPFQIDMAEDNNAWDVEVTADTANNALVVSVTGEAGKVVDWVASVATVEIY